MTQKNPLYKSLCIECQRTRKRPTIKGTIFRPILTKNLGSRSQVDFIDMQAMDKKKMQVDHG